MDRGLGIFLGIGVVFVGLFLILTGWVPWYVITIFYAGLGIFIWSLVADSTLIAIGGSTMVVISLFLLLWHWTGSPLGRPERPPPECRWIVWRDTLLRGPDASGIEIKGHRLVIDGGSLITYDRHGVRDIVAANAWTQVWRSNPIYIQAGSQSSPALTFTPEENDGR